MGAAPAVAVGMPVYNGDKYIGLTQPSHSRFRNPLPAAATRF